MRRSLFGMLVAFLLGAVPAAAQLFGLPDGSIEDRARSTDTARRFTLPDGSVVVIALPPEEAPLPRPPASGLAAFLDFLVPALDATNFTASTTYGRVSGSSATYATARSTSTGNFADMQLGQFYISGFGDYTVMRNLLKFDTSTISPDVATQVNLHLVASADNSTNADFDVQICQQTWAESIAANQEGDFDGCLSATLDNTWRNTSGMSLNTDYASNNLSTSIVTNGTTRYCLRSSRDAGNNQPGASVWREDINLYPPTDTTPSNRPYLAVVVASPTPTSTKTPTPTITPTSTPTVTPTSTPTATNTPLCVDFPLLTTDGFAGGGPATAYATARGTASSFNSSAIINAVGQSFDGSNYSINRSFLEADTSLIGASSVVTSATLSMQVLVDASDTNFDVQIVPLTWASPLTTGNMDPNYDACLAGSTDVVWANTSGISSSAYTTSPALTTANINRTGITRYCLRSSRDTSNTAPTGAEYLWINSMEASSSTIRPYLHVCTLNATPVAGATTTPTPSPTPTQQCQAFAVASIEDGYATLGAGSAVYTTARNTGDTQDQGALVLIVGQRFLSSAYGVWRGFLGFDTHLLSGRIVTSANLYMAPLGIFTDSHAFDVQVVPIGWTQPGAPPNPAIVDSNYDACLNGVATSIWANTTGLPSGYTASGAIATSTVNTTGTTQYCLRSSRDFGGTAPTDNEYLWIAAAEYSSSFAPYLYVCSIDPSTPTPTPSLTPCAACTATPTSSRTATATTTPTAEAPCG